MLTLTGVGSLGMGRSFSLFENGRGVQDFPGMPNKIAVKTTVWSSILCHSYTIPYCRVMYE